MLSLTIGNGSKHEVVSGTVQINGSVVILLSDGAKSPIVFAYHLKPGEQVRRVSKEEYVVEF